MTRSPGSAPGLHRASPTNAHPLHPARPPTVGTGSATIHQLQRTAGNAVASSLVAATSANGLGAMGVQRDVFGDAAAFVGGGIDSLKRQSLQTVKGYADDMPGYELLGVALGKDVITDELVDQSPTKVVGAVVGLIPGGERLRADLEQSGAAERAAQWLREEVPRLGITWAYVKGLFVRLWNAVGAQDLLDLGGLWDKLVRIFRPPVQRLIAFARSAGQKLMEFVVEGVIGRSSAGQAVLGALRSAGEAFGLIARDPIGFLGNLVNAVKGGLGQFARNILTHLQSGFFEWLTGALHGVIRIPQRFDLAGIFGFVTELLGVTYANLRTKLVRSLGESVVSRVEGAVGWVRDLVTGGFGAIVSRLGEMVSSLMDTVIGSIRGWIANSVVGAAITKLITMFNPAGAVIQALIGVYNTIQFFIDEARQIGALLQSVVGSISAIARGSLGEAVNAVEQALGRGVPVALRFLAEQIGLGDVATRVRGVLERVRAPVDRAMDRVVGWVSDAGRRMVGAARGSRLGQAVGRARDRVTGAVRSARDRVMGVIDRIRGKSEPVTLQNGEHHTIYLLPSETFEMRMASDTRKPLPLVLHQIAHSPEVEAIIAMDRTAQQEVSREQGQGGRASKAREWFKRITVYVRRLPIAGGTSASVGAKTPSRLGRVDRHEVNSPGNRSDPDPKLHLRSEHVIPVYSVSLALEAMGEERIPRGGWEDKSMHTVVIYKGAGERKDEGPGGDNPLYRRLRKVPDKVSFVRRWLREKNSERFVRSRIELTMKGIREDHAANGAYRGETQPAPGEDRIQTAVALQIEDIKTIFEQRGIRSS